MKFKRESIRKFIERNVLESLDPANNDHRITEVLLDNSEWNEFMKSHRGHCGSLGSDVVELRILVPLRIATCVGDATSNPQVNTHTVRIKRDPSARDAACKIRCDF